MSDNKLNPWVVWGMRIVGGAIIIAVIPLLNMVRSQDKEMQALRDTAQDVLIVKALAADSALAVQYDTLRQYQMRDAIWREVQAENTRTILEALNVPAHQIKAYPGMAVAPDSGDSGG